MIIGWENNCYHRNISCEEGGVESVDRRAVRGNCMKCYEENKSCDVWREGRKQEKEG